MNDFLAFFEFMPTSYKALAVAISLILCWIFEQRVPLFRFDYNKVRHGLINLFFFLNISVINLCFGFFLVKFLWFFQQYELGILFWFDFPQWIEVVISLLILDMVAQYLVHYLLHKVSWMWKFHKIHHSDTRVDATSGTRHHPGDYLLREIFSFATLIIMGIPVSHYFLFRFITIFFTYFTHANIRIPATLNRFFSIIFITPDLHKIHHHFKQPWTDRNYGNIFSIWDRAFGTLVQEDANKVVYGLDNLGADYKDNALKLLAMPWVDQTQKQS